MAGVLSDRAWTGICAAAGCAPDPGTRERLAAILSAYPAFPVDQFEAIFTGQPSTALVDVTTESKLCSLRMLRQHSEDALAAAQFISGAHRGGSRNVQHAYLYSELCTLWLYDFHGPLTWTNPPGGGAPCGPLIDFIAAVFCELDEHLGASAIRNGIKSVRDGRKRAKQLSFRFKTT